VRLLFGIDGSWSYMCNLGHTKKKESVVSKKEGKCGLKKKKESDKFKD
jgi:hypothetical protein